MRIVIGPANDDNERRVTVYDGRARTKEAEFHVHESEQAEVSLRPVQKSNVDEGFPPQDAGEVWAEIAVEEYRVVGE